jgi:stearoyl-CoA desaturase (delta-9 desaturase)
MSYESFENGESSVGLIETEPATTVVEPVHRTPLAEAQPAPRNGPSTRPGGAPKRLRDRFANGISFPVAFWVVVTHAGAIMAFWHFSWSGLALVAVMHFISACLGVTLGYHRLLTHGSFVVARPLQYFFALCGMLSAEGSPLMWVAVHRKHHAHSDEEEDPHSPTHGFWWSHMLWFQPAETEAERVALFKRWAPDLYRDPVHRFFHKTFAWYSLAVGVVLYAAGEFLFNEGLSWFFWGLCMRTTIAYHSTWFVNSATHIWGYRNYQTTDRSRNLWWVALMSYGEGWHNNHHAHQRLARHGHRWWEVDITYMVIRLLKALGLATKVQDRLPEFSESH